jgi:hypothetical protein
MEVNVQFVKFPFEALISIISFWINITIGMLNEIINKSGGIKNKYRDIIYLFINQMYRVIMIVFS